LPKAIPATMLVGMDEAALHRQIANLTVLLDVSREMGATMELDPLLRRIEAAALRVLDCERATVFLYDAEADELFSKVATGTGEIRFSAEKGTGSKYTANHVQRSMDFILNHGTELKLSHKEVATCQNMILCTDLGLNISTIDFPSAEVELLSKMLGAADLLAQMADRTYLEKLLFLYYEYKEVIAPDWWLEKLTIPQYFDKYSGTIPPASWPDSVIITTVRNIRDVKKEKIGKLW